MNPKQLFETTMDPETRSLVKVEIADAIKADNIFTMLNEPQREFVSYVLQNYVGFGVDELEVERLGTVVQAKYGSLDAAQKALGELESIRETFIGFQKHLYDEDAA